ncbi:hypothetical protein THAOC_00702 [Thalassiosira oceanica]|uniref:Uncharacterized protein n=1 Tax=Thalassiosira oceanica TaxID=159749 RepID=K0TNW7_THAOC|nr:hypothetical protein THAOC_00702 [Thalassiosira oceanica]|eukprot:EJK77466.1 hypothetical protein THAOC_00702 [Thalassiosira oceanica]
MVDRPREKRVNSREWSGAPYARLLSASPLGVDRSAHLQSDYSTLSGSVGSAGTTTIGRGYSDGSTAAVIYQTSRCNGKFAHHQTSPAYRGPRAFDNVISIEAGGYREVRYGIELSPCSAACPSGTIGPSTPPSGPISVLGSSAAPRQQHLCRLASRASSDLQIRRRRCRGELVYKSTFDVANRRSMEARGRGAICVALGAPLGTVGVIENA